MDVIASIRDVYHAVDLLSDPRVQEWPFVASPVNTYVMSISYIIIVWKIGPMLMRDREPMQLRLPLIIYNVAMTYLNFHIFKELLFGMIDAEYSFPCQPFTHNPDPKHIRIAAALWWYYISKLIEFIDTLFFVLRKKNNQISFLHVYHHSTMPMIWWIGVKWVPGSQSAPAALLNAFIHIVMYSYYGLSALGPQYQKYLWWKRYLTQMQLVQFTIALGVASYSLYIDCPFPRWMSWALISYMVSFLVLFGNFYLQAYIKGRAKERDGAKKERAPKGEKPSHSNGFTFNKEYELRERRKLNQ